MKDNLDTKLNVRMNSEDKANLEAHADKQDRSMGYLIRSLLKEKGLFRKPRKSGH